jgi:uncharacterized protein with PIN domain
MTEQIGRCANDSGCQLAQRKEESRVITKESRCPECGAPLETLATKRGVSLTLNAFVGVAADFSSRPVLLFGSL